MFSALSFMLLGVLSVHPLAISALDHGGTQPNFVLIMTDGQDLMMNSLRYQPSIKNQFIDQGVFYHEHFCTMAQCCPSRVS